MPSYVRLRDLIRNIRSQKTMADERTIVQKELAIIRTAFKEEDTEYRTRNVAKVLYIHMLGYPTHFAQLECLKLIASPKFGDKRMGYLGAMMLLDERTDVQMLLTNSLKVDMNASNQYICCLALTTLGNICSSEMARDLSPEVEKLLKSSNALIRKKAALCACRIIRKVPELLENYVSLARQLLSERNHGVLITGVTLLIEMCKADNETLEYTRKTVPTLVRLLKTLVVSGNTPDYDVNGVPDPFLQVRILQLLGILGHNDSEASDSMNDILAQVATNTESSRTVGNAILYETARTIMKIKAESGLRVLAVNILGRFLLNTDKNIRYVALNTLMKTVHGDMQAVQRHRATIVDCLKDPDISIRRRALELVFALMNHSNIRALMREILSFLDVADAEFKAYMCSSIASTAAKYAPNKRWHMDTLLKMLTSAGQYVTEELVSSVICMITQAPELHAYVTQRLYVALQDNISQQPTVQIASWCIGEYGDLLVGGAVEEEEPVEVSEVDVIDLLENILASNFCTQVTKEYVLMSLMKLTSRFRTGTDRIRKIIGTYTTSVDVELQQRAVEFSSLFDLDSLRPALLEKMPVREPEEELEKYSDEEGASDEERNGRDTRDNRDSRRQSSASPPPRRSSRPSASASVPPPQTSAPSNQVADLLDLLGGGDSVPSGPSSSAPPPAMGGDIMDLLGGLGGGTPAPAPVSSMSGGGVFDMLGGGSSPAGAAPGGVIGYDKNGVRLSFGIEKNPANPTQAQVTVTTTNSSPAPVTGYVMQAAVPKTIKMQLMAASGSDLAPGGKIAQVIRVANPQNHPLRIRIKVSYVAGGMQVQDTAEVGPL
eukprot:comp21200_c0_seq1/m.28801 comp21200_c0_seq1/g.28801  ORF comp21200_c0_seq1/g.28801 comp21200_c0_seq1/m.28801 type:complete len:832 (-) comp21200_c0_seq1:376-2871(-)